MAYIRVSDCHTEKELQESEDDRSWLKGAGHPSKALPVDRNSNETGRSASPAGDSQWPPALSLTAPARPYSRLGGFRQPGIHVLSGFVILGLIFGSVFGSIVTLIIDSADDIIVGLIIGGFVGIVSGAINGSILGAYVGLKQPVTDLDFKLCGHTIRKFSPAIALITVFAINFCLCGLRFNMPVLFHRAMILEYLSTVVASWIASRIVATKFG